MYFLVYGIGCFLIIFILWWFLFSRPRAKIISAENKIDILVAEGIYNPAQIKIPAGKTITLRFIRKDPSPCAEYVVFSKLNLNYPLPLNNPTEIILPPQPTGEIEFTCQMGMYRGKLIVE